MYKVFIDSLVVYFLKNELDIKNISLKNATRIQLTKENFPDAISQLKQVSTTNNQQILFICYDLESCWGLFKQMFEFRVAAGGVVINSENKILFIFRNGYWDLPKGHVDQGELIHDAAIREVEEECGITTPSISHELLTTYHIYNYKGKKVLKENNWYLMTYDKKEPLIPQAEEGIEIAEWKNRDEAIVCIENSYGSIIDVVNSYLNK